LLIYDRARQNGEKEAAKNNRKANANAVGGIPSWGLREREEATIIVEGTKETAIAADHIVPC